MASTHGRTLAVVGATGLVGRKIIEGLIARKFPIKRLLPVASERSKGKTVDFKGEAIEVMTIEEAIEQDSFYPANWESRVERGDVDACFASEACTHVVEGDMKIGAQDHFYLETNACVVIPQEGDEILTYSSTQAPAKHQRAIAHVLGVPEHKEDQEARRRFWR